MARAPRTLRLTPASARRPPLEPRTAAHTTPTDHDQLGDDHTRRSRLLGLMVPFGAAASNVVTA